MEFALRSPLGALGLQRSQSRRTDEPPGFPQAAEPRPSAVARWPGGPGDAKGESQLRVVAAFFAAGARFLAVFLAVELLRLATGARFLATVARFLAVFLAVVALRLATPACFLAVFLATVARFLAVFLAVVALRLATVACFLAVFLAVVALRLETVAFFWAAFSPPRPCVWQRPLASCRPSWPWWPCAWRRPPAS